ncbi:MAG: hypothetical protein O3B76_00725 [Proteobacteria bacterium]|nr:hypothetical protein [Pseudomonadota bacterium]MDA1023126.1 hypothetical protein [Pseudomonadota bacterium]
MVTVPKAAAVPATTNVSTPRVGPATRVASAYNGVDELQQNAGISFGAPAYAFNENDPSTFKRGEDRNSGRQHPGLVSTPTQAFVALLEASDGDFGRDNTSPDAKEAQSAGLINKAIAVYENNARVLSGDNFVLGRNFSLVL